MAIRSSVGGTAVGTGAAAVAVAVLSDDSAVGVIASAGDWSVASGALDGVELPDEVEVQATAIIAIAANTNTANDLCKNETGICDSASGNGDPG